MAVPDQIWSPPTTISYLQPQPVMTIKKICKSRTSCPCAEDNNGPTPPAQTPGGDDAPEWCCPSFCPASLLISWGRDGTGPDCGALPYLLGRLHSPQLPGALGSSDILTQAWNGGTSPEHFLSFQIFCGSKTLPEQSWSHRAGNKEQRLYLEGMRPLGGSS